MLVPSAFFFFFLLFFFFNLAFIEADGVNWVGVPQSN